MRYGRVAAVALLTASMVTLSMSDASARCWRWHCGGPGILALPFVVAGAAVAGAATIATAPFAAVAGAPGPYYYGPRGYYGPPPGYYAPPGYYYGPPAPPATNN
jgi:hypothetical protein